MLLVLVFAGDRDDDVLVELSLVELHRSPSEVDCLVLTTSGR